MPVRRVIAGPIGMPGSTNVAKRSPTETLPSTPRTQRAAPISMTRSDPGSNPVVSMSSATSSRSTCF
jgi:hypothetical protein